MAYISPKADDRWFKFNDLVVTKCSIRDAVVDNYGSRNTTTSAYMLIYIKNSCLPEILREVTWNEVVPKCLIETEIRKELKQLADKEHSFEVSIFTSEKLRMHDAYKRGKSLMDPSHALTFNVEKDKNLSEFLVMLGTAFRLENPHDSIVLWMLSSNKDTIRTCDFDANSDKPLNSLFRKDHVNFFVDILPVGTKALSPFDKSKQVIIFIREHDLSIEIGKLSFIGHQYFEIDESIHDIKLYIQEVIGPDVDTKDIAIIAESKFDNQYSCKQYDDSTKIINIASKHGNTYSARIVFEVLTDGNHHAKYISEFVDEKNPIQNCSIKQSSSSCAPLMVNVTIKHNAKNVLMSQAFEIYTVLFQIAQAISEKIVSIESFFWKNSQTSFLITIFTFDFD